MKKLYRDEKNKMLAGVCAGMARYYGKDPTLVRIIWIVLTAVTGVILGILAYLIIWIIMPAEEQDKKEEIVQ